ncbi:MAG: sulfite exporter TauE/SafE family protein [Oscillospiraceae bacterium]|nr:sulfite exporter TauE/SafE family protein [Oscillospiraceae bacterium]
MAFLIAAAGCCAVGLCIGWCGVAGFLLPILFTGACGLSVTESLLASFLCFAVSGAIGAFNYHRRGELPLRPALTLSAGSLAGGLMGAALGGLLAAETVKVLLYLVVLLSGMAIAVRELRPRKAARAQPMPPAAALLPLGLITAVICALSGAGGPVLVMPLLVALGVPAKMAVGVALLDSVFIALPAIAVYGSQCDPMALLPMLAAAAASHAVGVSIGSATAARVPQSLLKRGVAAFSICFSLYMLLK